MWIVWFGWENALNEAAKGRENERLHLSQFSGIHNRFTSLHRVLTYGIEFHGETGELRGSRIYLYSC